MFSLQPSQAWKLACFQQERDMKELNKEGLSGGTEAEGARNAGGRVKK